MADIIDKSLEIQTKQTGPWRVVPESSYTPPVVGSRIEDFEKINKYDATAGSSVQKVINTNNSVPITNLPLLADEVENPNVVVDEQITQSEIRDFVFPPSLISRNSSESGPFIKISGYTYKRGFIKPEDKTKKFNIYLPIPQSITQEYSSSLTNFDGSVVFDAGAAIGGMASGGELAKGILGGAAVGGAGAISAIASRFMQGTGSQILPALTNKLKEARSLASTQVGYSLNPRYEVAFNSMGLRQHSFEFNLVPTSSEEALVIDDLVHALRLASHPVISDEALSIFYKYPDEFVVSFHDADGVLLRSVPYIPDCIIANLGVTTSTGRMHSDNTPVATKLSIQFQETTALSRDDIRNISSYRDQYYK